MNAESNRVTPRRASLRQQVLLAALDCSGNDLEKTFTSEDLLVAAWKRDRLAWGLRGYEREFPDNDKIHKELDGRGAREGSASTGIVSTGLLLRVRQRIYRLTPAGFAAAAELYRGVRVWNRTQNLLNPTEGNKSKRVRPQSEWVRAEVPSMRIIPDDLWQRVQNVNQRMKDKIYGRRRGVLYCGFCGGKVSIIIGGEAAKVRYGCTNHRFRDICTNKTTILRSRLEHQLISAISRNLSDPRLEQGRIQDYRNQLETRIALEEKLAAEGASNGTKLEAERSALQRQAYNLVDAIGQHGYSSFLSAQLASAEARVAEIERLLTGSQRRNCPRSQMNRSMNSCEKSARTSVSC